LEEMMRQRSPRPRLTAVLVVASFMLLAACASSPPPQAQDPLEGASVRSTVPPNVGPADCSPPSPVEPIDLGLEVRAAATGGEVWALFQDTSELRSGREITVWWRIGGRRGLDLVLLGSGDREVAAPDPRPDPTLGWARPGDQWVGTITFPQPGCWRISATRSGAVHGDVWVQVS
jgi:hypothetical protein